MKLGPQRAPVVQLCGTSSSCFRAASGCCPAAWVAVDSCCPAAVWLIVAVVLGLCSGAVLQLCDVWLHPTVGCPPFVSSKHPDVLSKGS